MPSLLDDPLAPQATSLLPGVPALTIAPPDPAQPDVGSGLSDLYNSVTAELARQRQISRDMGLWTGGGLLEGGHPTMAGVADAANKVVQGILMGSTAPEAPGITAFHGSPYDFDKFDIGKIGTGEGAQAYGHGLYFAENPGVAQSYRTINAPPGMGPTALKLANQAQQKAADAGLTGDEARRYAMNWLNEQAPKVNPDTPQHYYDAINNYDALTTGGVGHMYEVNINADPQHFLDWDKPLSEQSQHVQDAIVKSGLPEAEQGQTAGQWVQSIYHPRYGEMDRSEVSRFLQEGGIPGIKYFDQGSRGAGQGTRNYVVFSPDIINIARKYAVPAAVLSGTGAGLVQQGQQPAS